MAAMVDFGNEILVPGKDHNYNQRTGQNQIDQRQHAQNDLGFRQRKRTEREMAEFSEKFDQQNDEGKSKAQDNTARAASGWRKVSARLSVPAL